MDIGTLIRNKKPPFKYDSSEMGIEARRNFWCAEKKQQGGNWFPCNWKGLIDRIKGYLKRDGKVTKISKDEQKNTIKEWMDILFGPKDNRYSEIKAVPKDEEGELLIAIMTAMSEQEEAEWRRERERQAASRSRRRGGKSRKKKRKTKRKKRKTKKRRRKRKHKTKKRK